MSELGWKFSAMIAAVTLFGLGVVVGMLLTASGLSSKVPEPPKESKGIHHLHLHMENCGKDKRFAF